jgi:hypothetical protein
VGSAHASWCRRSQAATRRRARELLLPRITSGSNSSGTSNNDNKSTDDSNRRTGNSNSNSNNGASRRNGSDSGNSNSNSGASRKNGSNSNSNSNSGASRRNGSNSGARPRRCTRRRRSIILRCIRRRQSIILRCIRRRRSIILQYTSPRLITRCRHAGGVNLRAEPSNEGRPVRGSLKERVTSALGRGGIDTGHATTGHATSVRHRSRAPSVTCRLCAHETRSLALDQAKSMLADLLHLLWRQRDPACLPVLLQVRQRAGSRDRKDHRRAR